MISNTNFQFCFDISLDEKLGFFVPSAYIIRNHSEISYVDKKATRIIIASYGIDYNNLDLHIQNLLATIEVLKSENIFKKFEKNPK